jgi:hypothetical protein
MIGPLQWAYDFAEGSKPVKPPGPAFPRGAWQAASYSSVSVVRAVARRSVRCRAEGIWNQAQKHPHLVTAFNMDAPTERQFDVPVQGCAAAHGA